MKTMSPPAPNGPANRLARLRALAAADLWRLCLAVLGLPLNALGVRLFGLRPWMGFLARTAGRASTGRATPADLQRAKQAWRVVGMAVHHAPYRGNCLSGSLTLWWLLRRQGLPSDLRIGVSTLSGRFEAHAWIEFQGNVINDRPDVGRRFSTFERPINSAIHFV